MSGNIYVAGSFTNDSLKQYVAKWNGLSWSELGGTNSSNFNNTIFCLTVDFNNNIYAGGDFIHPNVGYITRYIAKYSSTGVPVKLANLNAVNNNNNNISINWQTATELNNSNFIIQHSTNGSSYIDIGIVKSIGSGANSYSFTDNKPANGVNYYRLQSFDKDGSSSYSKVISVNFGDIQTFSIAPNPARDYATINFSKAVDKGTIKVYDITGKQVIKQSLSGTNSYKLNTQSLKGGLYVIKVNTPTGNYNEKLLINK